eukprot:scaffold24868_cov32-Tisochrysis_lutea.AAC.4
MELVRDMHKKGKSRARYCASCASCTRLCVSCDFFSLSSLVLARQVATTNGWHCLACSDVRRCTCSSLLPGCGKFCWLLIEKSSASSPDSRSQAIGVVVVLEPEVVEDEDIWLLVNHSLDKRGHLGAEVEAHVAAHLSLRLAHSTHLAEGCVLENSGQSEGVGLGLGLERVKVHRKREEPWPAPATSRATGVPVHGLPAARHRGRSPAASLVPPNEKKYT